MPCVILGGYHPPITAATDEDAFWLNSLVAELCDAVLAAAVENIAANRSRVSGIFSSQVCLVSICDDIC
jgi:hypothetical protein